MTWPAVLVAFLVSHAVGDYLLQTDWQARHKAGGLGRSAVARRALLVHGLTYTLAFVPALIWAKPGWGVGVAAAALVFAPHVVVDDGRVVTWWLRRVKGTEAAAPTVVLGVDQSLHLVCLWAVALLVAS
jgi:hypothetical protein